MRLTEPSTRPVAGSGSRGAQHVESCRCRMRPWRCAIERSRESMQLPRCDECRWPSPADSDQTRSTPTARDVASNRPMSACRPRGDAGSDADARPTAGHCTEGLATNVRSRSRTHAPSTRSSSSITDVEKAGCEAALHHGHCPCRQPGRQAAAGAKQHDQGVDVLERRARRRGQASRPRRSRGRHTRRQPERAQERTFTLVGYGVEIG